MALKPIVLTLNQDTTTRILATKGYRLKSELGLLLNEFCILSKLHRVESRMYHSRGELWAILFPPARFDELHVTRKETIAKLAEVERQLVRFGNEALPQATFSVWGTMTLHERRVITEALEPQEFKDGAVLIKQGEPRDAFFIIAQGQVSYTQRRDPPVQSRPRPAPPFWSASARHPAPQRPGKASA